MKKKTVNIMTSILGFLFCIVAVYVVIEIEPKGILKGGAILLAGLLLIYFKAEKMSALLMDIKALLINKFK